MCSDNPSGAVNQQERLDAYIAGFVDGGGSFSERSSRSSKPNRSSAPSSRTSFFANIVRRMEEGMHLTAEGFAELRRQALSMNGGGGYRRVHAL